MEPSRPDMLDDKTLKPDRPQRNKGKRFNNVLLYNLTHLLHTVVGLFLSCSRGNCFRCTDVLDEKSCMTCGAVLLVLEYRNSHLHGRSLQSCDILRLNSVQCICIFQKGVLQLVVLMALIHHDITLLVCSLIDTIAHGFTSGVDPARFWASAAPGGFGVDITCHGTGSQGSA